MFQHAQFEFGTKISVSSFATSFDTFIEIKLILYTSQSLFYYWLLQVSFVVSEFSVKNSKPFCSGKREKVTLQEFVQE